MRWTKTKIQIYCLQKCWKWSILP